MTFALQGICAAKGIAIGRVYIVDRGQLEVSEYALQPSEVEAEVERFRLAVETARADLSEVRRQIPSGTPAEWTARILGRPPAARHAAALAQSSALPPPTATTTSCR